MSNPRPQDLANIKKRFLQLHPVNATSGGVFSFRNGLPLIKFDISSSEMPLFLDGGALRISGLFTAKQGAAGAQLNNTQLNFLNGFAGFSQCIENITIYSKRLNTVLERINMYYRLSPSITSGSASFKEMETTISNHGGQHGTTPLTRPGLNCYDGFSQTGVVAGAANQRGQAFSMPLYCGMLNSGQDIDLSTQAQGGMVIEILLRSSVGTVFGADALANQAFYEISNLVLTAPVYQMGGASAQAYQNQVQQYNFNSWSSMFQTINASNSVLSATPGLGRVSSVLMNAITAADLGNQNFDSCRLGNIGEIRQLRFSRNGALFPLQYRLQTVSQQNNDVAKAVAGNNNSYNVLSVNADIFRNYLEGLLTDGYAKVRSCNGAFQNWSGGSVNRTQNSGRSGETPGTSDGFAILYDKYGSGSDFTNTVFSLELQTSATSQLTIGAANVVNGIDGSAAQAQAVTIFFLNKNTLLFSGNGIDIVR